METKLEPGVLRDSDAVINVKIASPGLGDPQSPSKADWQIFSASQPFPAISPVLTPALDASVNLSQRELPPLDSSPEPDLPDLADLLFQTRPSSQAMPKTSSHDSSSSPSLSRQKEKRHTDHNETADDKTESAGRQEPAANKAPTPISVSSFSRSSSSLSQNSADNKKRKVVPKASVVDKSPFKRRKSETATRKHDQFWILDGNVIIQVKNVIFKIHRSRLVQQSEYFANLFDRKDVVGMGVELYDGRPIYHVKGVSAEDFEALLVADSRAITYVYNPPSDHTVGAILRAATVLQFADFRAWAVDRLQDKWSCNLNDMTEDRLPNAIDAVILGRNYDVPRILKRSFYELLRTGGFALEEADEVLNDDVVEMNRPDTSAATSSLSASDIRRLISARERLTAAWVSAAARSDRSFVCPSIKDNEPCAGTSKKDMGWVRLVHESGIFEEYLYDPICGLGALIDINWSAEKFCDECTRMRVVSWEKQQEKLWGLLDMWLDLPRVDQDAQMQNTQART